jgi:hypothetical protein
VSVERANCVFSDFQRTGMGMGVVAWMVRCTPFCDGPLSDEVRTAPPTLRDPLRMCHATVDK